MDKMTPIGRKLRRQRAGKPIDLLQRLQWLARPQDAILISSALPSVCSNTHCSRLDHCSQPRV